MTGSKKRGLLPMFSLNKGGVLGVISEVKGNILYTYFLNISP